VIKRCLGGCFIACCVGLLLFVNPVLLVFYLCIFTVCCGCENIDLGWSGKRMR